MIRGEVWDIYLGETLGDEITGKGQAKTRPAVIASNDNMGVLKLKVIVPITEWKAHFFVARWMVRINPETSNGLSKISAADAFQVRSVAQERFVRHRGTLSRKVMRKISFALAEVFNIELVNK